VKSYLSFGKVPGGILGTVRRGKRRVGYGESPIHGSGKNAGGIRGEEKPL